MRTSGGPCDPFSKSNYRCVGPDFLCSLQPKQRTAADWRRKQIWGSSCLLLKPQTEEICKNGKQFHTSHSFFIMFGKYIVILHNPLYGNMLGGGYNWFLKWVNNFKNVSVLISKVINVNCYNPCKQMLSGGPQQIFKMQIFKGSWDQTVWGRAAELQLG